MKVLVIHHLQSDFADGIQDMFGLHIETVMERLTKFIRKAGFDYVIATLYASHQPQMVHITSGLISYVNRWVNYDFGWEEGELAGQGIECAPSWGSSQEVPIERWMKDLRGHSVTICGCFDGGCLTDLESALNFLDIEFNRLEQFIF